MENFVFPLKFERLNQVFVKSLKFFPQKTIGVAKKAYVKTVVLSGGCFYNTVLVQGIKRNLENLGMKVYVQTLYPCGDGGISLGQAASAAYRLIG